MKRDIISAADEQIEKAAKALTGFEKHLPKVTANAVNRSAQSARSELVRSAREEYEVKAGDVRGTIRITSATTSEPTAIVVSRGSPVPLARFSVRPKTVNGSRRTPIRVSVKKGSAVSLDRGFIYRTGKGVNVFERVGTPRLPIKKLYGPSVPQMLNNDKVASAVVEKAQEVLEKRLDHEISRVLKGGFQ